MPSQQWSGLAEAALRSLCTKSTDPCDSDAGGAEVSPSSVSAVVDGYTCSSL